MGKEGSRFKKEILSLTFKPLNPEPGTVNTHAQKP
jgi:hypothetical protein